MSAHHLLYLAFWYPPSRASGVYRALATSLAFSESGWDVTVLTCDEGFLVDEIGSIDRSLLGRIPESVNVVRVPYSTRSRVTTIDRLGWFRANYPELWRLVRAQTAGPASALDVIRGRTPAAYQLADSYSTWIEPAVAAARSVHRHHPVDLVLATGNPFSAFEVARVASALIDRPFVIDYRDPWTIDVFTGAEAKLPAGTIRAEASIVADAAACIHVNDAIADAYRVRYPDSAKNQHVVFNGFDADSVGPMRAAEPGAPLTFGMLGTVNDRWPLDAIFGGWGRAQGSLPANSRLLLAGHLGYFARSVESLREALPDEDVGFEYVGPVHKAEVGAFYGGLDVVVVPAPGGAMVTSGKVFEAAALGVPVVCVQGEGGGARAVLEDHPSAFFAEPDPSSVSVAFREAASAAGSLTQSDRNEIRRWASRFERSRAMAHMVTIAEDVVAAERVASL